MSRSVTHRLKCTACPHRITVEVDGPSFFTDGQRCAEGVATIAGHEEGSVKPSAARFAAMELT